MLLMLFSTCGYKTETLELRRQKSGTQNGFDILLKVYDENFLPLTVFTECKGSKEFGSIPKYELSIKSDQLKRTSFPAKDIHLFFSPTLSINYANDETPIEDDENPFCVVNMMRKDGFQNYVFDLFMAYPGSNEDIINFRESILAPLADKIAISDDFETIAAKLKNQLTTRIEGFIISRNQGEVLLLSPSFWNHIKSKSQEARLPDYYIRLDSVKTRLFDVVANEFHIPNINARYSLVSLVRESGSETGTLIKILSNGGEGKSTFLLDTGKQLCVTHPVFFIRSWTDNTLNEIKKQLKLLGTNTTPVILLDDAAHFETELETFGEEIANWSSGIILILAERYYRYQRIPNREAFESLFQTEPVQFNFQSKGNAEDIFEKFFALLKVKFSLLNAADYKVSKELFLTKNKFTTAERIFEVLRNLQKNNRISFSFDWDEWTEIHKDSPLKYLYLIVSAFYQFGNSITIDFCKTFNALGDVNTIDIRNAIDTSPNQPIIRNGEYLQLRHEKVAEWYIEDEKQEDNVRFIYQQWLAGIDNPFSKNLLLWTYRNYDFIKCGYLEGVLTQETVLNLLNDFISKNPNELSARTEAARVLKQMKRIEEAKAILLKIIEIDKNNLHARTELSKIYQQQKKWKEAEDILIEEILLAPDALHPRTELSKIYQQQKKWKEAEDILIELLQLDKGNFRALTERSLLYKKWMKGLNPGDPKKRELKEKYLLAVIESFKANPENISILMELASIFTTQKQYRAALGILENIQQQNKNDLESMRVMINILGYMNAPDTAEEVRKKGFQIIAANPFVKYRDKFENMAPPVKTNKQVNVLTEKGMYGIGLNEKFIITTNNKKILLGPSSNFHFHLKHNAVVLFSLIVIGSTEFADNVEPYFEDVYDLTLKGQKLKNLLIR